MSYGIGALAIMVANPTDLVKVRLQAEGKLPPGVPRRYSGALNAYSTIVKQVVHQTFEIRKECHLVSFQLIILFSFPKLFLNY